MADHEKPTVTSNYLDFVSEMHGRMDDLAVGLDPERTSATNVPNYSIRWSSVAKKWQYLDGSSWKDLTNEYAINIAGYAEKLKTSRNFSITGGITAGGKSFDGSSNVALEVTAIDPSHLGSGIGSEPTEIPTNAHLGSASKADVVQAVGSSQANVMSQKAVTEALSTKADASDSRIENALQSDNNLSDVADAATARDNLELKSAATRDVGTSEGSVMEVGAFGLGKAIRIDDVNLKSKAWWNSLPEGLSYLLSIGHTNGPISNALHLIITKENNDHGRILAQRHSNTRGDTWTLGMSAGGFGEWDAVLSENSLNKDVIYTGSRVESASIGTANRAPGTVDLGSNRVLTGLRTDGEGNWYSIRARGHNIKLR